MSHLFLAGLLRTCLAIPVRPAVWADRERGACRDAVPGDWCHAAVMWAKESGYERHPDWFPGDASQYSLKDFQALLHQLGEAECPRPCPQDSGGQRPALGLIQLQSSAVGLQGKGRGGAERRETRRKASIDQAHGLRPAELAAVVEAPWRPRRNAGRKEVEGQMRTGQQARPATLAALGGRDTNCQDAQPGSMCHHAAAWLHDEGVAKHPTWYPSLSVDSTMQEVQSVLHDLGKAHCPKPCTTHAAKRLAQSPDDRVLEVDGHGRQVLSQAYELSGPTDCGDAVEGDWCYISIMWLKGTGLQAHPDWYPTLTDRSSIGDFQIALHNEGKVGCPLPCVSSTAAPTELPQVLVSPSARVINEVQEACEDARFGSHCYRTITHIIDVGLRKHPELYPELTVGCSRQEVQEHLFLRRKSECGRPCPQRQVEKPLRGTRGNEFRHVMRVKKNLEDMTIQEMTRFLNRDWDGYVETEEHMGADAAKGASAKENVEGASATNASVAEETLPVNAAGNAADECGDASVGDQCHKEVTWAQTKGILEHPNWYPGLSKSSTFKEIQAFLHDKRGRLCQMPCPDAAESVLGETLPIVNNETHHEPSETQDHSAGDALDECRDASVGDQCHKEVTWAQMKGILEHPKWYPGLSKSSTFKEFQAFVHQTRGRLCQMPCPDVEGDVLDETLPIVNNEGIQEPFVTDEEVLPVVADEGDAMVKVNATTDSAPPQKAKRDEAQEDFENQIGELEAREAKAEEAKPEAKPDEAQEDFEKQIEKSEDREADAEKVNSEAKSDKAPDDSEKQIDNSVARKAEAEEGKSEAKPDEDQEDFEKQIEKSEAREAEAEEANSEAKSDKTQEDSDKHIEIPGAREAEAEEGNSESVSAAEAEENDEIAKLREENERLRAEALALRAQQEKLEAGKSAPEADADTVAEEPLPVVNGDGQEALTEEAAKILLAARNARARAEERAAVAIRLGAQTSPAI